jgi:tripartite-type tricarboxylate transporter receptor subunit TctC
VKIIVPFEAGSAADRAVRIVAERMNAPLGQSVVIENLTGAGGLIGTNRLIGAAADGYTLAGLNMTVPAIQPHMQPKLVKFDPFSDFVPIHGLAAIPTFLGVSQDLPVANVAELIALARAKPGALNYSSGGAGSPQHLAAELFQSLTGTNLTHVPYKGATAAATDLAAGRVQVMFIAHSLALPHLPDKRVKLIAFTGTGRAAALPDLPSVDESGVSGFEYSSWVALLALKGTPPGAVARLRDATVKALAQGDVAGLLQKNGLEVWDTPAPKLASVLRADFERWGKVVRGANLVQN